MHSSGYLGQTQIGGQGLLGRRVNSPGSLGQTQSPEVSPGYRRLLPRGNRFFPDAERESIARTIDWTLEKSGGSGIFATLTFKNEVSAYRGDKMSRRWLAQAQQSLKDKGGGQLKSFRATEWQKRGVIHYHVLLIGLGLGSLSRKRLENRWIAMSGGFCRCYEADRKAAPYLAKYTSKTLGGEVDWGGTWQGLDIPASVSWQQAYASDLSGQERESTARW